LLVSLQIQSQPAFQRFPTTHPIHRLLHLAVAAVPSLDRVGGRRQQLDILAVQLLMQQQVCRAFLLTTTGSAVFRHPQEFTPE
jgi:hypothetical protein